MKKQKFEVGTRIAFTIYSGRHKGTIIFVNDRYMIVRCEKENVVYSFCFDDQIKNYKIKRLVKKKKPVEKRSAREWWAKEMDNTVGSVWWSPAHRPKPLGEKWFLVREVLDEPSEICPACKIKFTDQIEPEDNGKCAVCNGADE